MSGTWIYVGGGSGPTGTGGTAQVLAVHAALLPTGAGKILYFSGSQWAEPPLWEAIESEPNPVADPGYVAAKAQIDHTRIYDCGTQQVINPGSPDADLFCSGHAFLPDGRLVVAGGTQYFPDQGEVDLHHAHWSGSRDSWLFDHVAQFRAAVGATVTAVWNGPSHLDLFAIGADGTVQSTWWEPASSWVTWFQIQPTVRMQPGAAVTAVWNGPGHLDLFATGTDGTVWSTYWEPRSSWVPWFTVHAETKVHPGSTVTALWNGPAHLDIFATGTDGTVWSAFWESKSSWVPWFPVHPEMKMEPGTAVTALWNGSAHLDIFATGTDGTVWSAFWEPKSSWVPWFPVHPEMKVHPGSTVTALWNGPAHLDIFATGTDGTVWSAFWESKSSWVPWFPVHPEMKMEPGTAVTALWNGSAHLDIFATGTDGTVWSAFWEPKSSWVPWFPVHPETKMHPGSTVTALWNGSAHLDIFATGLDGSVRSAFWEPKSSWVPWFFILSAHPWTYGGQLNRDPDQVAAGGPMGGGRWYPTLVTLADGGVLALTGHPLIGSFGHDLSNYDNRHNNTKPEVYDAQVGRWKPINKALGTSGAHDYAVYYPRLHVLPHTGELFVVQPLYSSQVTPSPQPGRENFYSPNPDDTAPPYGIDVMDKSLCYNVATQQITRAFPGPQVMDSLYVDALFTSQPTTSVMLPLRHEENYHPRVLVCGGAEALVADLAPASGAPQWIPTASRQLKRPPTNQPPQRYFATATLLPTGDVLVSGGVTATTYKESDGIRTAEIYHPAGPGHADSWTADATAAETRGYHSVALLTPDGRVWTAGSEFNDTTTPNLSIELFEPAYYQVSDRATIRTAPAAIGYQQGFSIEFVPTSTNTPITDVVLMRCGSVTHSFDGDQRYVSLSFSRNSSTLTATAPPDSTVAPPGYYMLWIIDANRLPCKTAPFIRLA